MFIRRRLRKVLSWKFVFYDRILPVLRWLGPARRPDPRPAGPRRAGDPAPATGAAPRGAARAECGARRGLADGHDLAGAGVQHRAVPGARLPAGPPDRTRRSWRGSTSAATNACTRRWPGAGARSSSAATWGPTSRACTGSIGAASRSGCWCSGPATSRASWIAGSTPAARTRRPSCSCAAT